MRPFWKPVSALLIGGGLLFAAWPFGQTLYGQWSQRDLQAQFQAEEARAPRFAPAPAKVAATKAPAREKIAPWPLTKISAPDINLDAIVVQGWEDDRLRRGPGHYERSSPPGQGNCVIAGHRNVYGSPFGNLDRLLPGSIISLQNRSGTYSYAVASVSTASASDWSVTLPPPAGQRPILTLLTCTIPHTPNRVVVRARLVQ